MSGFWQRASSWASAAMLAALTLAVFATAQDRGPVSTVNRFHDGLGRRDAGRVGSLLAAPLDSPASLALVESVGSVHRAAEEARASLTAQDGRAARVAVVYRFPAGISAVEFVLVRPGDRWLIDPAATLALNRGRVTGLN